MSSISSQKRVVSGMRVSGQLHLGHYHGVIKNWLNLQHQYECFLFAADWHGLTTHYENPEVLEANLHSMVTDWLACGINPGTAKIFVQSQVIEHAELHLALSMITPLGWLERMPTYKDQQEKLKERDLATYGFLGYPVLMSADVLAYRAGYIPVGEDQTPHVEFTRELARRFNHIYGREPGYEEEAELAIKKMGKKNAKLYQNFRRQYMEQGDKQALEMGQALVESQENINTAAKELLVGYLEGGGKVILPEPEILLTKESKFPGLDGQKMSKSYGNTISLRESDAEIERKIKTMQTDPARIRLTDPGDPDKCPVWQLHQIYSDDDTRKWVQEGCRGAKIGCIDCKMPICKAIQQEIAPIREKAAELDAKPSVVKNVLAEGAEQAREVAVETLGDVKSAMGVLR